MVSGRMVSPAARGRNSGGGAASGGLIFVDGRRDSTCAFKRVLQWDMLWSVALFVELVWVWYYEEATVRVCPRCVPFLFLKQRYDAQCPTRALRCLHINGPCYWGMDRLRCFKIVSLGSLLLGSIPLHCFNQASASRICTLTMAHARKLPQVDLCARHCLLRCQLAISWKGVQCQGVGTELKDRRTPTAGKEAHNISLTKPYTDWRVASTTSKLKYRRVASIALSSVFTYRFQGQIRWSAE